MAEAQVSDLEPTPRRDLFPEVLFTSGVSLKTSLSSSNVDVQEILEFFWKSSLDWNVRRRFIAGLMLSAAGCHTLNYQELDVDDTGNLPSAEETDKIDMAPRALDPGFITRYSKFICRLFKMVPREEGGILFLRNIVKIICRMIVNPWDSIRMIGACTGIKLLTFCIKASSSSLLESPGSDATSSGENASYFKKQFISLKNIMQNGVFKKTVRDVLTSIRSLAFAEMIEWARHDPHLLLQGWLQKALCFGLCDKKECAIYALTAVEILFREDLGDSRQVALFVRIQDALVMHLGSDPPAFPIQAMSTLASAASFIKKTSNTSDLPFLCIFNKHQAIAVDAAKYLFRVHDFDKDLSDPVVVLKKLLIFFMEAQETMKTFHIKASEDLLVDAFYPILKTFITWQHWEQMLTLCEAEHTVVVAKMFCCYVRKATTNYCPPGRIRSGDSPKKKDLLSAANAFTKFIARTWKTFYSLDKISLNPEAMGCFTRVIRVANTSLPSHIAFDIIEYLAQIAKMSSCEAELSGIWSTISHLYKTISWDVGSVDHLKNIFYSVKNCVVEEFSEIFTHLSLMMGSDSDKCKIKLLFVIKFIEPHDNFNSLWEKCSEELNSQLGSTNLDVPKVGKILEVLHGIVMRQFKTITTSCDPSIADSSSETVGGPASGDSQMSVSPDLISEFISRGQYHQNQAVHFLRNCEPLRLLCFDFLVDMVVCFGKHMAGHATFMIFSDSVIPDTEPLLVQTACSVVRQTYCIEKNGLDKYESPCCHVLKHTCELFAVGMIDITKIDKLLSLTGVNEDHDLMVMAALKDFAERYRSQFVQVAAAIATGLCGVMEEVSSLADESVDRDFIRQTQVAKIRERCAYWNTMVDFLAVLRNSQIRDTFTAIMKEVGRCTTTDLSSTSEFFGVIQPDADSEVGASLAAPESDFSLAFAERSMIPHSTPYTLLLTESQSESDED